MTRGKHNYQYIHMQQFKIVTIDKTSNWATRRTEVKKGESALHTILPSHMEGSSCTPRFCFSGSQQTISCRVHYMKLHQTSIYGIGPKIYSNTDRTKTIQRYNNSSYPPNVTYKMADNSIMFTQWSRKDQTPPCNFFGLSNDSADLVMHQYTCLITCTNT